jgi:hypothetical protein
MLHFVEPDTGLAHPLLSVNAMRYSALLIVVAVLAVPAATWAHPGKGSKGRRSDPSAREARRAEARDTSERPSRPQTSLGRDAQDERSETSSEAGRASERSRGLDRRGSGPAVGIEEGGVFRTFAEFGRAMFGFGSDPRPRRAETSIPNQPKASEESAARRSEARSSAAREPRPEPTPTPSRRAEPSGPREPAKTTGPSAPRPPADSPMPSYGAGFSPVTKKYKSLEPELSPEERRAREEERRARREAERQSRMPGRVVDSLEGFDLGKHRTRVAVLGRGHKSGSGMPFGTDRKAEKLGELVGQLGFPLVTGGGRGLPREAEKAAHKAGGETWAVSGARDVDEQMGAVRDLSSTSVLFPTGTGGGAGAIEREAPLVQAANIRTYLNGGPGTFGELIAGLHAPGVLAFLDNAGGVSGAARSKILPYVNPPKDVRTVFASTPEALLERSQNALRELRKSGVRTTPKELFTPREHRSILTPEARRNRNVFAFLTDDGGLSTAGDREATERLLDRALSAPIDGKDPLAVFADSPMSRGLAQRSSRDLGRDTHLVSSEAGASGKVRIEGSDRRVHLHRTGKGPGVGKFASHREVTDPADVLFVTSAHFENLAGLAFALRQSKQPIIAVLELESTGSKGIEDILRAVKDGPLGDRFVFAGNPERLVEKVKQKLERPPEPPPRLFGGFGGLGRGDFDVD